MSSIFNVTTTGNFANSATFTAPMSTVGAAYSSGTLSIPIGINTIVPGNIDTDIYPIRGIFLNINSVASNATGMFTIKLYNPWTSIVYNYYTSALCTGATTGIEQKISEYWQGFDLLDADLSVYPYFNIAVSSTNLQEISLVGGSNNNINRFFIPSTATNYYSAFMTNGSAPDVFIGSYLQPIAYGGSMLSSVITNEVSDISANSIKVCNSATLNLSTCNIAVTGGNFLISPGGTLSASHSSTIKLKNSKLIGLNSSVISITDDYILPYTFLAAEVLTGVNSITVTDNISSWLSGDRILFTGNSAINTFEQAMLTAKPTDYSFDIATSCLNNHYSINNASYNIFSTPFYGTPVVNTRRNTAIIGLSNASIRAEASCNIQLENISVSGTGILNSYGNRGSINLFNRKTTLNNNYIAAGPEAGIYIQGNSAIDYNINNNSLHLYSAPGIVIQGAPDIIYPADSFITNNVISNIHTGIAANFTNKTCISGNIINGCHSNGMLINIPDGIFNTAQYSKAVVQKIDNNIIFRSSNDGLVTGNIQGTITNTTSICNTRHGVNLAPGAQVLNIDGICTSYNSGDGVYTSGGVVNVANIVSARNAGRGMAIYSTSGTVSGLSAQYCSYGAQVIDCSKDALTLFNFNLNYNTYGITYAYPSTGGWNFYPTYLIGGNITHNSAEHCIELLNTKCEKFVVDSMVFDSSNFNIKLSPYLNQLIEGSYIFTRCTFGSIPFDDIATKYQTDVLDETGFVSMYERGNNRIHSKTTVAGRIESSLDIYKNTFNKISEKLTPTSLSIPLKSGKRIVYVDNFDNNVPPNLTPEYLFASVWIKKSDDWGSNSAPVLKVACNPTLGITQDTVIATHNSNTTDWVQLSSTSPIVSAVNTRGAVELYIECNGTSGGSIFIDDWAQNIVNII